MPTLRPVSLALLLALNACGADPDESDVSPFFLWGARPGLPLDSVEQVLIRADNMPWRVCEDLEGGFRRCERYTTWVAGTFQAIAAADGRVVYISFAPSPAQATGQDLMFDEDLSGMQRQWVKTKDIRLDPHGVSDANPHGTAEMRTARGRYRALMTFDGRRCSGTSRPCPALVQLVEWPAAQRFTRP